MDWFHARHGASCLLHGVSGRPVLRPQSCPREVVSPGPRMVGRGGHGHAVAGHGQCRAHLRGREVLLDVPGVPGATPRIPRRMEVARRELVADGPRWLDGMQAGDVHVWWLLPALLNALLSDTRYLEEELELLSEEERLDCNACWPGGFPQGAWDPTVALRVLSKATARRVLGRYLGIAPGAVCLAKTSHGKPRVVQGPGPGVEYSVTHTRGIFGMAVGHSVGVGLDAERLDRATSLDPLKLAKRRMHEDEVAQLAGLASDAVTLRAGFNALWTAKEAFVKAAGRGISAPPGLRGFAIELPRGFLDPELSLALASAGWSHRAAIALHDDAAGGVEPWGADSDPFDRPDGEFEHTLLLSRPAHEHVASLCLRAPKGAALCAPPTVPEFLLCD